MYAHLDGRNCTLSRRESNKGARLARSAASAHHEDLLNLAMLREYLRGAKAQPAQSSARAQSGGRPKAVRLRPRALGLPWNQGQARRASACTCCSTDSSVPGGAPPTKSLFSGLGEVSVPAPGSGTPPPSMLWMQWLLPMPFGSTCLLVLLAPSQEKRTSAGLFGVQLFRHSR